ISRLDRGLANAELTSLHDWLEADHRHREALFEMAALWDRMDLLKEMAELFPLETSRQSRARRRAPRWAPALAPCAVTVLAVAGWAILRHIELLRYEATYQTRVGEQRTVALPDGSVVMLNTATKLKVIYTAKVRSIELLEGEAHFQVAKNA